MPKMTPEETVQYLGKTDSGWYDKQGKPLSILEASQKFEDVDYKTISHDILSDGTRVSTVWLGLDHSFFPYDNILIFETMVFPSETDYGDIDSDRYSTLAQARAGHIAMLKVWRKKIKDKIITRKNFKKLLRR